MPATGQVTRSLCTSRSPGMTTGVLIAQCLQRGFAGPIGPHEPLPGLLPAGYSDGPASSGPGRPTRWDGWSAQAQVSLSDTK